MQFCFLVDSSLQMVRWVDELNSEMTKDNENENM